MGEPSPFCSINRIGIGNLQERKQEAPGQMGAAKSSIRRLERANNELGLWGDGDAFPLLRFAARVAVAVAVAGDVAVAASFSKKPTEISHWDWGCVIGNISFSFSFSLASRIRDDSAPWASEIKNWPVFESQPPINTPPWCAASLSVPVVLPCYLLPVRLPCVCGGASALTRKGGTPTQLRAARC